MIGRYEGTRDAVRYPDCWQVYNDHCVPHFHSSVEVVYQIQGSLAVTLNGQRFTVSPGEIAISSSYTMHGYESVDNTHSIVLTVPLDFVPSIQTMLSGQQFKNCVVKDTTCGELLHCLYRMAQYCHQQPISPTVLKGYTYLCIGLLIELSGLEEVEDHHSIEFSREVLSYIQQNYLLDLTVESVAAQFGYSKSRFSHLFSKLFGCGFRQYLIAIRCRYATAILLNGNTNMIEAAMGSGFQNMRTFYRNFQQVYHMTPTQLLDSYNNGHISMGMLDINSVNTL